MTINDDCRSSQRLFRVDSLATAISLLLVMTVLQRVVGLGRNVLFCRLLDPEQLGEWNLAFSVIVLAAPLLALGLPGSFGRYVEYHRQRGTLRLYLRRTLIATSALTLCGVALLVVFHRSVTWMVFGHTDKTVIGLLVFVSLVPIVAFNAMVELSTALRQVRLLSILQLFNSLLFAGIGIGLLIWYQATALSVVMAYALACFISVVGVGWPLFRTVESFRETPNGTTHRDFWGRVLPFAGWIWISNLATNLFGAVDRTMIVHFSGTDSTTAANLVGQYHSSRVIPEVMLAVAIMLAGVMLPYLTSDWERGDRAAVSQQINRILKLFGVAAFVGSICFIGLSPWLFNDVLQGKYAMGLSVVPLSLTYCIWSGQLSLAQQYLMCAERAGTITWLLIVGLVVNVGSNFFLLPYWGLAGAVASTAAANGLTLVLTLVACRQHGLQVERGTWVIIGLPVLLLLGGWLSMVLGATVLLFALTNETVVSADDRARIRRVWGQQLGHLRVGG